MCGNRFSNIENKLSARRGGPPSTNILDFSVTRTDKSTIYSVKWGEGGRLGNWENNNTITCEGVLVDGFTAK